MTRFVSVAVSTLAALLAAAGVSCGGTNPDPAAPWISGEYVSSSHEVTVNSCGFSTSFHQDAWQITQDPTSDGFAMDHAAIHIRDASSDDGCRDIGIRFDNGSWKYEGAGSDQDGECLYDWTVHGVVVFSEAGVELTEAAHYEYKSGTCESWTPPCDYSHSYRAVACDRCWPGCATVTATGRAIVLP